MVIGGGLEYCVRIPLAGLLAMDEPLSLPDPPAWSITSVGWLIDPDSMAFVASGSASGGDKENGKQAISNSGTTRTNKIIAGLMGIVFTPSMGCHSAGLPASGAFPV
jgi:hypothetical protein